jgi:single-strand DNA-binding protein
MRDVATAQLSGNLTRDVDLRSLPSGADVAKLRVASTTRRRAGEEWVDKTNYFTVEVFGAQARNCAEYLRKGSRVFVDAELDWHEWTDQQESKREAVTLKARKVLFEDRRPQPDSADGHTDDRTPSPAPAASQPAAARVPAAASAPANEPGNVSADELPY